MVRVACEPAQVDLFGPSHLAGEEHKSNNWGICVCDPCNTREGNTKEYLAAEELLFNPALSLCLCFRL